jgi:hypothetical protein
MLAGLIALGTAWGAAAEEPDFRELVDVDLRSLLCPCAFNRAESGADDGGYGSGPRVLVLDQNGEPPTAIVDIGGGPTSFTLTSESNPLRYACEPGERVTTDWSSGGTRIALTLTVLAPGEEACWFEGSLAREGGVAIPIKGACGC